MTEAMQMQKFVFASANEVGIVVWNEKPWFDGQNVADILGYKTTEKMTRRLDNDEWMKLNTNDLGFHPKTGHNLGGTPMKVFLSESGLYHAIFGSKKPEAKEFRRWVTETVLPSIRKHGVYMTPHVAQSVIENPDNGVALAQKMIAEKTLECKGLERMLEYRKETYKNQQRIITKLKNKCDDLEKILDKWIPEYKECPAGKRPILKKGHIAFVDENGKMDLKNREGYRFIKKRHEKNLEKHRKLLGK